jgi:hypothetical protein
VNDLSHHVYDIEELVIGDNLEAVSYSYLNEKPLILNSTRKPYFFEFFEKDCCLSKYPVKVLEYELVTPHGTKVVGASKLGVWEKLVFNLSVAGLIPAADKVYSIRIEDNNLLKIITHNSRVVRIKFDKLRIFDTKNISGFEPFSETNKFKAIDWINVRSGMKHEYDYFETEDNFVKEVYFYPSPRMGSGEKDERKDLVAVSYLTKEQLDDFGYSDTYAKFKILSLMKEAGIKGPRNGRRHDDPNKYAYHSIKIEPSRREIQVNEKLLHEDKQSCIFDNRKEREIYFQSEKREGYVNKISKVFNA